MIIRGLRWWIVVLVFLAAVLNYVDRQTLFSLAPTIQADLKMDAREYANIVNLFLVAYTVDSDILISPEHELAHFRIFGGAGQPS